MITLVVDFHSSTTYLQSQKFLALVTTLKYFFQSVRKILSGPCMNEQDLAINCLQRSICHKTQSNNFSQKISLKK